MTSGDSGETYDGAYAVFNHATAPNSALYRRVLAAFVDAKERFQVHLRPDDIVHELRRTLAVDEDTVTAALESLVGWGNLLASPDTGRVVVVEDFYLKRQLFQLSREGEAVERAFNAYDEALGRRGALQAVALADIEVGLREVLALVGAATPGGGADARAGAGAHGASSAVGVGGGAAAGAAAPSSIVPGAVVLDLGKLQQGLAALTNRFSDLADNASAFMSSLQRTIDLTDTEEEVFAAYKTRLVEYLERFIKDLTVKGPQIAKLLATADAEAIDRALGALASRDAASVAPDPDDPEGSEERERLYSMWRNRWAGLRSWFLATDSRDSQAKLLRVSALAAIPSLLDVVRSINARRSGRSDRSSDYLRLAQWFQEAENDDDRHRLWRTTFGLYSARHLSVDVDTWQAWEEASGLAGVPWAAAPSLRISPQLRRTGSYERRGRPNQVIDRSAERAMLALRAEQETAQIAEARKRVATSGTVELASIAGLDSVAFGLFLSLLGDALVAKRADVASTTTSSSDGSLRIELTTMPDAELVAIRTERGVLYGPNHLVHIHDSAAIAGRFEVPA